jgi:hypothetical protein
MEGIDFDVYLVNETTCGTEMVPLTFQVSGYSWEFSCIDPPDDGSVISYQVGCTIIITWVFPISRTFVFIPNVAQGWCASTATHYLCSQVITMLVVLALSLII